MTHNHNSQQKTKLNDGHNFKTFTKQQQLGRDVFGIDISRVVLMTQLVNSTG